MVKPRTSPRGGRPGCQLNLLHLSQNQRPKNQRQRSQQTIKRTTRNQQKEKREPRARMKISKMTPRKKTTLKTVIPKLMRYHNCSNTVLCEDSCYKNRIVYINKNNCYSCLFL